MQQSKLYHFFIVLFILTVSGCATTNQAPFPLQQYHDLTSRFNAYFNTKEKLKIVLQGIEKTHRDNFEEVIPVYFYTNSKEFASNAGELEDIEKRCNKSLRIHTYTNFADDHFLLIGKANYFKGDYDKALLNLKFITTEYKDGVDYVKEMKRLKGKTVKASKKKKPAAKPKFEKVLDAKGNLVLNKIDERPSYSIFVHEPARAEALIWLAKTYTAQGKFIEAASVIQFARSDDKFYKNLDKDLELADANLLIQKKDYLQAITPLEKYLTMTKKKKQRLRPLLALAQINERLGNYAKSANYYKLALKSNPGYDMEFFAKMQQTRLSRKGKVNLEEVKKILVRMSRDGKYKDNLDQIYFELGEITLGENNRSVARQWYHKSVDNSTKNAGQKGQSFLRLAQMDFEEELYKTSKYYYDSAITGMSAKDTNYEGTIRRAKVLGHLVEQLNIISTEDSLQRIAGMSEADRNKFIKKLIAQKEKEKEKKEREKSQPVNNNNNGLNPPSITPNSGGDDAEAAWYFYNPVLRNTGYTEFVKRWGKRKFEENWRRKDKTASLDNTADSDTLKKQAEQEESALTDVNKYTAGLPMTPEKMTQSNGKLIDAYYTGGTIYKDDLNSLRKANQMFEDLVRKFPKSKFNLEAYYQIYLIAQKTKNNNRAEQYKALILAEYPDSKIAKYIQDPNYLAKLQESDNALANYYKSTYEDYSKGLYADATQKCKLADVQFKPNTLKPKFDLLNAMIEAKENRLDDYVQSLNKIIAKHAGTPEQDTAKKLLADLNSSKLPMKDLSKEVPDTTQAAITKRDSVPPTIAVSVQDGELKKAVQENFRKLGEALTKIGKDSAENKVKEAEKVPYKPLSKSERLDSIIKAEKKAKQNPQPVVQPTPETPAVKESDAKVAYKPLSKAERLDSLMKAEKKAKQNPTPVVAPVAVTPVIKTDTAKDTYKPLSKSERLDSIMKADKKPKQVPQTVVKKDSVIAHKVVGKDTVKKVSVTKVDSLKAKPVIKPVAKIDSAKVKPVAKATTKVDSAKIKAVAKLVVDSSKLIAANKPTITVKIDSTDKEALYGTSDAAPHQVIIYFKNGNQFSSSMSAKLEAMEQAKFPSSSLMTRSVILDNDNKLISIKPFKNKQEAMDALTVIQNSLTETIGVSKDQVFILAVSTLNYTTLISTKRLGNYLNFYKENYK